MGEVFAGRYELVDVLGHGGMGDVWRVWDHREDTYRAAKLLRQSDSVSLLRFVRETSWRVDHHHVVAPTGWAGDDDRVLFTMPIVGGGSLATVLADHGTVPWPWARQVLVQVLEALAAVHDTGLVHRDVKPANILLEPSGTGRPHAFLSDFGIAVHVGEPRLTRASEILGTRGYVAPEILHGADPDPAQDVYAVGVLAREMLGDAALGTDLDALVDPDPVARPANGALAADLVRHAVVPEVAGEPVEVFDQLPDLPPGWGPSGASAPETARADDRPRPRVPADVLAAAVLAVLGVGLLTLAVVLL